MLAIEISYTDLRKRLASILDLVAKEQQIVIVRRRASKNVALISARGLAGLIETEYLLRSPKNATRLLMALVRANRKDLQSNP